jgi:hypothetical protein
VHSHTETALDTPKKEGTESSFPVKVHAILGKTPAICKIFGGAKRKMQMLGFMHMHKHKLKRRISAASSASAKLSKKVEAAGTPDWSGSGRRCAPERGCHGVTGVRK